MLRSHHGLSESRLEIYRRVPPAADSVGVDSKEYFLKSMLQVKEVFLEILDSLTAIISNDLSVHFSRQSRSSTYLFYDYAFIWKKDLLLCNFSACISSISKYLGLQYFLDQNIASRSVIKLIK